MAKKRFTDIEIWDKEWFMDLSPKHKCLIKYICDKCDAAGCWRPNWRLASLHIGEKVTEIDLDQIPSHQYEVLENGKIFIPDFINFQYGTLSKKSPAHNPVFDSIEKNSLSDRVFNRVSDSPKEKDKDKEKDKEMEKDKESGSFYEKKFLVPEMQKVWKTYKPNYPDDVSKDFTALQSIAIFICDQSNIIYAARKKEDDKKLFDIWSEISKFVSAHNFYKNYSLLQVEKHIQTITQEIRNEKSGNNKNGKSAGSKVNGEQVHAEFTKFYQSQQ